MTILKILEFPDENLRIKAKPVSKIDQAIFTLSQNMLETMYSASGIGLAATQVDKHIRLLVIDISATRDQPLVLINPVITPSGEIKEMQEGCLSVPGYYETVSRLNQVHVEAKNEHDEDLSFNADGLLAACIQHECDHLNGKLFIDYLSALKRNRLQKKFTKLQKQKA